MLFIENILNRHTTDLDLYQKIKPNQKKMNHTTQNTATNFISENRKGLVILFVLFLLSSVGMFGQTKTTTVVTPVVPVTSITTTVAFDSDIDFMNWFMGSKQTQTIQEDSNASSTLASKKKQILSSGITPNKVLYRTFVKKVISQESAVA